jgi:voltage-gated sodium channel
MFTLFQMMTMDNWSAITKQVMAVYPLAWIPFILYILTTTFLVLNLAVGVIGSAVAGAYEEIESHVMEVSSSIGERNEDSIRTLERKVDKLTFLIESMAQQQNGTEDSDFNSFEEEIQTREQTGDTF